MDSEFAVGIYNTRRWLARFFLLDMFHLSFFAWGGAPLVELKQ